MTRDRTKRHKEFSTSLRVGALTWSVQLSQQPSWDANKVQKMSKIEFNAISFGTTTPERNFSALYCCKTKYQVVHHPLPKWTISQHKNIIPSFCYKWFGYFKVRLRNKSMLWQCSLTKLHLGKRRDYFFPSVICIFRNNCSRAGLGNIRKFTHPLSVIYPNFTL